MSYTLTVNNNSIGCCRESTEKVIISWTELVHIDINTSGHIRRSVQPNSAPSSLLMVSSFYKQASHHRWTDRPTERQTNRQADRQTDRQTDKQTDRQTQTDRHRQTDRQTDYFIVADPLLVHILNFYDKPVLHSEIL